MKSVIVWAVEIIALGDCGGKGNMDRLTRRSENGTAIYNTPSGDPIKLENNRHEVLQKLAEYEDLEERGKLLKLPCAVGDTVYEVQELRKRIQPYTIIAIHASRCGNLYGWELKDGKGIYSNVNGFSKYAIGKTVFFTRGEAEDALKELCVE